MVRATKLDGVARLRKLQTRGTGRAVAARHRRQSGKAAPAAASRGRRSGKGGATVMQDPMPFLRAVRYPAPVPAPRWSTAAYARVGTDCAGIEVAMSVLEDLKIETDHVCTLKR